MLLDRYSSKPYYATLKVGHLPLALIKVTSDRERAFDCMEEGDMGHLNWAKLPVVVVSGKQLTVA